MEIELTMMPVAEIILLQSRKMKDNDIFIKLIGIQMLSMKLDLAWYLVAALHTICMIPLYVCLSPLCMISSSLFDWTLSWIIDIDDQTLTLMIMLLLVWTISAILIFQLIKSRAGKTIFFYEFVLFLTGTNFILIGVTYNLLKRYDLLEEVTAKICSSLFLIYIAEKIKTKIMKAPQQDIQCRICLSPIDTDSLMILKCKHAFHEKCIWDWIYIKQQCPFCRKPI